MEQRHYEDDDTGALPLDFDSAAIESYFDAWNEMGPEQT